MIYFLCSILFGIAQTASFQMRNIYVYDGNTKGTFFSSILISFSMWFSTYYIVNHDYVGFIAFSCGVTLASTYISWKRQTIEKGKEE